VRVLMAAWALFVAGGLLAGWSGLQNLRELLRPRPVGSVETEAPPVAAPAPQPRPLPARAPLRSPDEAEPPFAPAAPVVVAATPQPNSPSGRLTILLLGIDQRPDEAVPGGDPGRTDSMLLVSLDYDAHMASMVSIPRDGFTVIPGHGNDRINAAYTYGEIDKRGSGPELAKRTVASLVGVPVDRFALVDVHSMEQIIDTLGGVSIDVPNRLLDTQYPTDDYRTRVVDIPAGRQTLDGVAAVEYARMRHPDSDYGRQGRQQQLLLALRDAALRFETVQKLPQLIPQVQRLVRTDLTPAQVAQLVAFGRGLSAERDIVALPANPQFTPSYTGPGGAAYINLTPAYRTTVKGLIEQPGIAAERANITVYNAGAPVGSGSRAADLLGRIGLVVSKVATAQPISATRIQAGSGARQTAAAVARALGLESDALVLVGDSTSVEVLLGPDARLPTG
jgi:polyisoprenyl-teichoic acid--peptidoglycan teichoic acid transferase